MVGPNKDIVVLPESTVVAVRPFNRVPAERIKSAPPTEVLELADKVNAAVFKSALVPPDNVMAGDLPLTAVDPESVNVAPENILNPLDADKPTFVPAVFIVVPDRWTVAEWAFIAVVPDKLNVAPENILTLLDADNPIFVASVVMVVPWKVATGVKKLKLVSLDNLIEVFPNISKLPAELKEIVLAAPFNVVAERPMIGERTLKSVVDTARISADDNVTLVLPDKVRVEVFTNPALSACK